MDKYEFGKTYPLDELKNYVGSNKYYHPDFSKFPQMAIRNDMDVVAEFYMDIDNNTAKCIWNIHTPCESNDNFEEDLQL